MTNELSSLEGDALKEALLALGVDGRKDALATLGEGETRSVLAKISEAALVALGRQGVAALGSYRARLTKRERVKGKMVEAQTLDVAIRPEPFAFRLEFKSGPGAGRRALYNVELRADEIRVKEAGLAGVAGALWLRLDNPLTRGDTNHRATEVGFAPLLDLIDADLRAVAAAGKTHVRTDTGIDAGGVFGSVFDAPPGVAGLHASSTRIGFDLARSLPVRIEVSDASGPLESYRWEAIERATFALDYFTLRAASL